MEKITRFLECLVPVTTCNLKCEYCYVMQENRRNNSIPKFNYSPEHIGKALSKKRLGGCSLISITGAGETLFPKEMPDIIANILKQGHYVNITTNGTLKKRFEEIVEKVDNEDLKRLHFSFSFHYLELKKINMVETFFENFNYLLKNGCSGLIQINLYDGYLPYLDEIKELCAKYVGAYPQVATTRLENVNEKNYIYEVKIHSSLSKDEYKKVGETFKSPLFDMTIENFDKKQTGFCYAGDWSLLLNLATGDVCRCYFEGVTQNIFENINRRIKFKAVGKNCKCSYCFNSTHFLSLGVIPELKTKTYGELRNRPESNWYTDNVKEFLNSKLNESHKEYNKFKKFFINKFYFENNISYRIKRKMKKIIKNEK